MTQQETPTIDNTEIMAAYEKSEYWFGAAVTTAEILLVCYTLPHSLAAFGYDLHAMTGKINGFVDGIFLMLAIFSVAVLEVAFVMALNQFTHGNITTETQRKWTWATLGTTAAVLGLNAIVAELPKFGIDASDNTLLMIYQRLIMPLTVIGAMILLGMMKHYSSKVQEHAAAIKFASDSQLALQAAEIAKQKAKSAVTLQRIESAKLTAQAEAKQVEINEQAKIDKMLLAAELTQQENVYAGKIQREISTKKADELSAQLAGDEFQATLQTIVQSEVKRVLSQQKKAVADAMAKPSKK